MLHHIADKVNRLQSVVEPLAQQCAVDVSSKSLELKAPSKPRQPPFYTSSDRTSLFSTIAQYTTPHGTVTVEAGRATHLESSLVSRLRDWSDADSSCWLWIRCPYERGYPTSASAIVASLMRASMCRNVPIAYQFCAPSPADDAGGTADELEAVGVSRLLMSLICQIATQDCCQVPRAIDLSNEPMARLDESRAGFDEGLILLQELFGHITGPSVIAIDGVDHLDARRGARRLSLLLNEVRPLITRNALLKFKILLTTVGDSFTLKDSLEASEMYDASHWKNKRSPGSARAGRTVCE
ncbi:MAG: hypothetical protein MMC23_004676 [Stictis urceolatum]|nr:hypothetical protein [Stictis urceolata]